MPTFLFGFFTVGLGSKRERSENEKHIRMQKKEEPDSQSTWQIEEKIHAQS